MVLPVSIMAPNTAVSIRLNTCYLLGVSILCRITLYHIFSLKMDYPPCAHNPCNMLISDVSYFTFLMENMWILIVIMC